MKKFVYCIGFFVLFLAVGAGFYASYRYGAAQGAGQAAQAEGRTDDRELDVQEAAAREASAGVPLESYAVETEAKAAVGYILKEENDRVVVYCADGTTLFEYTDIFVSELPYELQSQIRRGKEISGSAQLYSFLENYSS